jgi:hypothetical protein
MGVRIAFSGSNDNQGGWVYGLCEQNNNTVVGFTVQDIMGEPNSFELKFRDSPNDTDEPQWYSATWQPAKSTDFNYQANPYGVATYANYPVGILIKSAVPSQPFNFEVVWNYEIVGDLAPRGTRSHNDVGKTQKMLSALENMKPNKKAVVSNGKPEQKKEFLSSLFDPIESLAESASNFLMPAIGAGMMNNILPWMNTPLESLGGPIIEDLTGPGVESYVMPVIEELGGVMEMAPLLALML